MNINLVFETLLLLFSILVSNGLIYSLTLFNLKNYTENISVLTNKSKKDVLAFTWLIASNPLRLTSSSSSQTLNMTSSESSSSQILSVSSSDTLVNEDIFDSENLIDLGINEEIMTEAPNTILIDTYDGILSSSSGNSDIFDHSTSLDSITILNRVELEQWRDLVHDLHDLPFNTPIGILQQIKFEELNILYRQDLIEFAITQSELRHIIELIPAMSLFRPDINHFILTIMSYFHL